MKLDLILENVRNKYTLGLLEESTVSGVSESDTLKGKIFINESTMMLRSILLEENVMANVQNVLADEYSRLFEEFSLDDSVVNQVSAYAPDPKTLVDPIRDTSDSLANMAIKNSDVYLDMEAQKLAAQQLAQQNLSDGRVNAAVAGVGGAAIGALGHKYFQRPRA